MPGIPCLKTSKGREQQNLELRYFSTTGPLSHFYYLIMVTYFGWLYVMTSILVTISASVIVGFSVSIFQHTKTRYPCHIQRSIWFPFNRLNFFCVIMENTGFVGHGFTYGHRFLAMPISYGSHRIAVNWQFALE